MGVMNRLRDNAGAILIVLVFAFGVIWVLNDVGLFDVTGARASGNLIVVDGEGISIEEYQNRVSTEQSILQQQNPEIGPQGLDEASERAFQGLVEDKLIEREMARLGVTVSDEEVRQMIIGPNPHPIIRANFSDGQNGVNRAALQSFIDQTRENPEARQQLIQLEQYLRAQRQQEKFAGLVGATARVSEAEVVEAYNRSKRITTADVVGVRYAVVPDDSARVSDDEVRAYYRAHQDQFERKKTWAVTVAGASKQPSAEDSALVRRDLEGVRARFGEATDDSTFLVQEGSERPYAAGFVKPSELEPAVAAALYPNPQPGQIVGPIYSGSDALLVKVKAVRPAEGAGYARARHILISAPQADSAARRPAIARINDLKQRLAQGASFETLARENSQDPASSIQGGDLGWFTRDAMVAAFANAVFNNPVGTIVGPVETEYGVHLIEVTGRATQDVQVATYGLRLRAESNTLRRAEDQLEDFRYEAEQGADDTAAEARRLGLDHEQYEYQDGQFVYPGVGRSAAVRRFLERADAGDVSPVFELDERFVVVVVREVTAAGVRPFDEVRDEATQLARNEKRKQVAVRRLRREVARGFDGLAERVMGQAVTASLSGEAFEVSGFGPQPRLAGALFVTPQGRTTPVIEGFDAAFVARATQVASVGQIPAAEREAILQRLLNQKRQVIGARFRAALREAADVEDNRAEFLSE